MIGLHTQTHNLTALALHGQSRACTSQQKPSQPRTLPMRMQLLRFMHIPPGVSHADLWLMHSHTMPCQCTCARLSRVHARLTKAMSIRMEQGRAHVHEPKPCRASAQQAMVMSIHMNPSHAAQAHSRPKRAALTASQHTGMRPLQPHGTCAKADAASPARATRMIGVYRFAYFVRQVPLASHFLLLFSPFEPCPLYHHARLMARPAANFKHHGDLNPMCLTFRFDSAPAPTHMPQYAKRPTGISPIGHARGQLTLHQNLLRSIHRPSAGLGMKYISSPSGSVFQP